MPKYLVILLMGLMATPLLADDADLLIADFEGETYGAWKVTGDAFGPGRHAEPCPTKWRLRDSKGRNW